MSLGVGSTRVGRLWSIRAPMYHLLLLPTGFLERAGYSDLTKSHSADSLCLSLSLGASRAE